MARAPREQRLISRYTREEMGCVWSEEGKFRRWLEVELAATETLAASGVVPAEAAAKIREKARVDAGVVKRIAELEAKVKTVVRTPAGVILNTVPQLQVPFPPRSVVP